MIKVQDWIASIPDSEKHIAYVGEGKSEQRDFLLCGEGWERYKDWTFYLDMAFDLTSVTTHDNRQVVQTTHNSTESREEGGTIVDEVTTKETYSVDNVHTTNHDRTDIAPLTKATEAEGIRLTWTILRQHTVLPGKLWATIRAVYNAEQRVKKSAIMVFEVDPAICAVSAAVPPISEFEQMEMRMDALRMLTEMAADDATNAAKEATASADAAMRSATTATTAADGALGSLWQAREVATEVQQQADNAATFAQQAQTAAQTAATHATTAAQEATRAETHQQSAAQHAASAALSNQGALLHREAAYDAAEQCHRSVALCEEYVNACTPSTPSFNRINVRNYGAVGDGVADDRAAIIAAFEAAKSMLPCEVYFPAGTYGISNGITVSMALGTGGLLVRGAGWNTTTIKYMESYNPRQTGNQWYAIRIWPAGMPNTKPTTEEDYLHDICITGLSVYDTDPCAHAIHPDKGDSNKEETHGFDIQYCKRVSVTDCKIDSVGDEAVDIFACHDVIVANNHIVNSPGAGSAGGAISIGDGSKGVVVSGNTINGTAEDETLENGTVIAKSNFGIAVESLATPIADVIVTGNTIKGVRGSGVHFNTPNTGASITNLSITNNILNGCTNGIVSSGTNPMDGVKVHSNTIVDCAEYGINLDGGLGDVTIVGNTIRNCKYGAKVVRLSSRQLYADNLFEDIVLTALYVRGQTTVKNCVFKNVGSTADQATIWNDVSTTTNGTLTVSGCTMMGVRTKNAIYGAQTVRDTDIEFVDENGDVVYNHNIFGGTKDCLLRDLSGGKISGRIEIHTSGSVFGVKLTYAGGSAHAVQLNANRTRVIGCFIDADNGSYKAIVEKSGMNHNLIANNIVNKAITVVGAQSVAVNNIDTRTTE